MSLSYEQWLKNRREVYPNTPSDTPSISWGYIVWFAAQNAARQNQGSAEQTAHNSAMDAIAALRELTEAVGSNQNLAILSAMAHAARVLQQHQ